MTAFVHFGPHKTGSTFFQKLLSKKEEFLNKENIRLISQHSKTREIYTNWRKGYFADLRRGINDSITSDKLMDILRPHFRSLILMTNNKKNVIFSDENILGWPLGHFFRREGESLRNKTFYSALPAILNAVRHEFSLVYGHVYFYLVKREWQEISKSLYKDCFIKNYPIRCETLDEFISFLDNSRSKASFDAFWNEASLSEELNIIPYSNYTSQILLSDLCKKLKISVDFPKDDMNYLINKSLSDEVIKKFIDLHPFLDNQRKKYSKDEMKILKKLLS